MGSLTSIHTSSLAVASFHHSRKPCPKVKTSFSCPFSGSDIKTMFIGGIRLSSKGCKAQPPVCLALSSHPHLFLQLDAQVCLLPWGMSGCHVSCVGCLHLPQKLQQGGRLERAQDLTNTTKQAGRLSVDRKQGSDVHLEAHHGSPTEGRPRQPSTRHLYALAPLLQLQPTSQLTEPSHNRLAALDLAPTLLTTRAVPPASTATARNAHSSRCTTSGL
jgi:hypothetical protein